MRSRHSLSIPTRLLWVAVIGLLWICVSGCQVFGERTAAQREAEAARQMQIVQEERARARQQYEQQLTTITDQARTQAQQEADERIQQFEQQKGITLEDLKAVVRAEIASGTMPQIDAAIASHLDQVERDTGQDVSELRESLIALRDQQQQAIDAAAEAAATKATEAADQRIASRVEERVSSTQDGLLKRAAEAAAGTGWQARLATHGPYGMGAVAVITLAGMLFRNRRKKSPVAEGTGHDPSPPSQPGPPAA